MGRPPAAVSRGVATDAAGAPTAGTATMAARSSAGRHYSGRVVQTDRELAQAVASLLASTA